MNRRDLLLRTGGAAALAAAPTLLRAQGSASTQESTNGRDPPREIRIGYQKSSVLAIAKHQKRVETRFSPREVAVRWVEFPYGPPLLEALGAARLDYGYTGNAPPVFAQAARAPILYVAAMPAHGDNVAIVVLPDSPLKTLRDLEGKTVGVAKGSSGHDHLVAALDSVGVSYTAIKPAYLAPADGASAFARGAIDAWAIWDPFLAIAETSRQARHLPVTPEAAFQNTFLLANRDFTQAHPDVVATLNAEVAAAAAYAKAHTEEATRLYAAATGVDLAAETLAVARTNFEVVPLNATIVAEQQRVADRFARINLIPAPVRVADLVWTWTPGG